MKRRRRRRPRTHNRGYKNHKHPKSPEGHEGDDDEGEYDDDDEAYEVHNRPHPRHKPNKEEEQKFWNKWNAWYQHQVDAKHQVKINIILIKAKTFKTPIKNTIYFQMKDGKSHQQEGTTLPPISYFIDAEEFQKLADDDGHNKPGGGQWYHGNGGHGQTGPKWKRPREFVLSRVKDMYKKAKSIATFEDNEEKEKETRNNNQDDSKVLEYLIITIIIILTRY